MGGRAGPKTVARGRPSRDRRTDRRTIASSRAAHGPPPSWRLRPTGLRPVPLVHGPRHRVADGCHPERETTGGRIHGPNAGCWAAPAASAVAAVAAATVAGPPPPSRQWQLTLIPHPSPLVEVAARREMRHSTGRSDPDGPWSQPHLLFTKNSIRRFVRSARAIF